jgi:hypothetical protein
LNLGCHTDPGADVYFILISFLELEEETEFSLMLSGLTPVLIILADELQEVLPNVRKGSLM